MNKSTLITASIFGVLGIVLGAFGAHGLKELITPEAQQTFETGVRYQMYHALFLLYTNCGLGCLLAPDPLGRDWSRTISRACAAEQRIEFTRDCY